MIVTTRHDDKYLNNARAPKSGLSFRNKLGRFAWGITWNLLFRISPRPLFSWRAFILRAFGAQIGKSTLIYPSTRIFAPWNLIVCDFATIGPDSDIYCVGKISIGKYSVISQYAFLCTASHKISSLYDRPLITNPIVIEKHAWIAADAYIGPGVTVSEGAVVAARAVVVKNVEPWNVVGGNPAKFIKIRKIIN